jgi:hypothetical protein
VNGSAALIYIEKVMTEAHANAYCALYTQDASLAQCVRDADMFRRQTRDSALLRRKTELVQANKALLALASQQQQRVLAYITAQGTKKKKTTFFVSEIVSI